MARTIPTLGLQARHDNYRTTPTQRRQRRWGTARNKALHRVKNGVNDTYTYFHLVDELATLRPWTPFTSAHLADWLNGHRPQFIFQRDQVRGGEDGMAQGQERDRGPQADAPGAGGVPSG